MNKQDKELLLKDLCARLPYGVNIRATFISFTEDKLETRDIKLTYYNAGYLDEHWIEAKPYLRPISSMTKQERKDLRKMLCWSFAPEDCPIFEQDFSVRTFYSYNEREQDEYYDMETMLSYFEFLNSHHFDYRGLIKKGLALEAPDNMYNFK